MENLALNTFRLMTLFKKMINCGDTGKKLILGTFTHPLHFPIVVTWQVRFLKCYFIVGPNGFFYGSEGGGAAARKEPWKWF